MSEQYDDRPGDEERFGPHIPDEPRPGEGHEEFTRRRSEVFASITPEQCEARRQHAEAVTARLFRPFYRALDDLEADILARIDEHMVDDGEGADRA